MTDDPKKESLWKRIKRVFQTDVIVRPITPDDRLEYHPDIKFKFNKSKCNHIWGNTVAHDVFFRSNSNRRPVECEKCYTLKWVSLEEYQNIHKINETR